MLLDIYIYEALIHPFSFCVLWCTTSHIYMGAVAAAAAAVCSAPLFHQTLYRIQDGSLLSPRRLRCCPPLPGRLLSLTRALDFRSKVTNASSPSRQTRFALRFAEGVGCISFSFSLVVSKNAAAPYFLPSHLFFFYYVLLLLISSSSASSSSSWAPSSYQHPTPYSVPLFICKSGRLFFTFFYIKKLCFENFLFSAGEIK